jgi:hypothetical protein
MDGFYKVRIMAAGQYFDCWQKIVSERVAGYVKEDGEEISPVIEGVGTPGLPDPHECMVLDKVLYFEPKEGSLPAWKALRDAALDAK